MTEKEKLVERAEELGLETENEDGKALTIAELKVAITAAEAEADESGASDDDLSDDDAVLDPAEVEAAEEKLAAKDKYRVNVTVMLGSRRIEPSRKPVLLTAREAAPLVKLGHAVKV